MTDQSATTTISRTVTVAAGDFAPGHLGELTRYLPFELVDDVLAQTRAVQRRLRDLPSRAGVYFVLALGMFPRLGYARVWGKLTAGLVGLDLRSPSEKGVCQILCARGFSLSGSSHLRRHSGLTLSDRVLLCSGLQPRETDLPFHSLAGAACPGFRLVPGDLNIAGGHSRMW